MHLWEVYHDQILTGQDADFSIRNPNSNALADATHSPHMKMMIKISLSNQ